MDNREREYTDIKIRLLPRASKNQVIGWEGDACKIKVTSPPVDGEANQTLLSLLSKRLGIPKRNIEIMTGQNARLKRVRIYGLSKKEIDQGLCDQ